MTPAKFVAALADYQLSGVFNPYADLCPVHDRPDATKRRRANFSGFLKAALDAKVDTLWIARDLGYRGGRRTGIPLTDEVHLSHIAKLFAGVPFERATHGPIVAERTAAIVWRVIGEIGRPVLLWNVFPFHPHEEKDPFSNRCHTRAEREACKPLLMALLEMVQPRKLIAIGRDAQSALADMGVSAAAVRHPSYGGQAQFISGLYSYYGVEPVPDRRPKQLAMLEAVEA
ncbi:MAG: uracil-DNA glycosylase [Rhizobiaceae bacterium]